MLSLHSLRPSGNKKRKRVGRGNASAGNYSGKGMKGQRQRSGGRSGLKRRGLKQSLMASPKKRGFISLNVRNQVVNVVDLERAFNNGEVVNPKTLLEKGLVRKAGLPIKILGTGTLKKQLTLQAVRVSKTVATAVTHAGGSIEEIKKKKKN